MMAASFLLPRSSAFLSLGRSAFTRYKETLRNGIFHVPVDLFMRNQKATYVQVTMKWKKDSFYDSIESIHRSHELKAVISLKNCIIQEPSGCVPISAISKRGDEFDVPVKVARFLRKYPSIFEEFTGEKYNLPWFRLTQEATELHKNECIVCKTHRSDLINRLKKLVMMSKEKKLPLKIVQGLQWYLGLPHDFLKNPEENLGDSFEIIKMEDDLQGLKLISVDEALLSEVQKNVAKLDSWSETASDNIAFQLYPSKGLRLKQKISTWLDEFQKLPYISPYVDSSQLDPNSDISEKRVVGVLHELLCLFVGHFAERKKLLCLRKHLGLPQRFYKTFGRHPHIFYLSLKNMTCKAILKEAYNEGSAISKHPVSEIRMKYVELLKQSEAILKERQRRKSSPRIIKVSLGGREEAEARARTLAANLMSNLLTFAEIADASFLFACREFSSKSYVRCVRSDGGRKQSSRKRTASGKTSEDEKGAGPSLSGGKPLDSARQEVILALFSRIQSSIAKENSSEKTRMVAKIEAEDIPKRKQVRGKGLKGPAERTVAQRSSLRTDADLSKGDIEISRPISKFVKRSPIPVEPKETVNTEIIKESSFTESGDKVLDLQTLEKMKIIELKELAKSKGLKGYSKLRKGDLVELLKDLP